MDMDLTRLPVSLGKVRTADKAGIEKDRKQFWDKLFEKVCFLCKFSISYI